jgi:hypothetical protein
MPTKKKEETKTPTEKKEETKKKELCGHINRHSTGTDGKLDNVKCDLEKGHSGNHSGVHKELEKTVDTKVINGEEVTTTRYDEVDTRRGWNDMAGTPVSEIPVPPEPKQPTMLELEKRVKELEKDGKWKPGQALSEIQVAR